MFEHLKELNVIIVSGPQRSGTTICAQIVAHDTGYRYVDESQYGYHNEDRWRDLINQGDGIVIHCPAMCHLLHEFASDDRVAVVFMRRDLRDIIASQERIGWTQREEPRELAKYNAAYGPIALVKYDFWERWQRDLFPEERRFEVEYESLSDHPLWVPKENRSNFGQRQTA